MASTRSNRRGKRRRQANLDSPRPASFHVRASAVDASMVIAKAERCGMSPPRLLLESALADGGPPAAVRGELAAVLLRLERQVVGMATNANQLARIANSTGATPSGLPGLIGRLNATLDQLDAALDRVAGS